ncbi:MAG: ATP-binding protein [Dehalococcoidia bacterium]|nr:ATP-binding protein [Dehalococcoidia bacterium]
MFLMTDGPDAIPPIDLPDNVDVRALLDSVVGNIIRLAGSDAGFVSLWDPAQRRLRPTASYGLGPMERQELEAALGSSLTDALSEADAMPAIDEAVISQPRPRRVLTVPLRRHGRLVGLLCLFQPLERDGAAVDGDPDDHHVDTLLQNARVLQGIIEEKRWLEAVINHAADGVLILDAEGRILGGNPAFYQITGLSNEQVFGRWLHDVFELPEHDTGQTIIDLRLRRAPRRVFEASRAIILGDSGEPVGGVVSLRDITARREAEELQSTFLSVISHELKTPVAVITGNADLLADDATDPDEVRRRALVIKEEGERLSRMVENLLEAGRIQSGALALNAEPIAIDRLLHRTVRRLRAAVRSHRLISRIPSGLPTVVADWDRIEQVLQNLIDNAVKYSPPGGRIIVSAEADPQFVIVRVIDDGEGVPPSQRDRIFERFARLDSRVTREAKGAGLGLFICKAIVQAHGGAIWVEDAPSSGACFAFSLPRERTDALPGRVGFAGLLGQPEATE